MSVAPLSKEVQQALLHPVGVLQFVDQKSFPTRPVVLYNVRVLERPQRVDLQAGESLPPGL